MTMIMLRFYKYRTAKRFCKHKFSWSTNKHTRGKNVNFMTRPLCLTTLLTISLHENGDPSGNWICIQTSKRKHVSHCQRKNCQAKGSELAPMIHLQLRWWQASWSQFAQCFYDKIGLFFVDFLDPWLEDNVLSLLNLSARNFWGRNFHENKFSWAGVRLRKLGKFSHIWYVNHIALVLHVWT